MIADSSYVPSLFTEFLSFEPVNKNFVLEFPITFNVPLSLLVSLNATDKIKLSLFLNVIPRRRSGQVKVKIHAF
jgi:hypothetical protein